MNQLPKVFPYLESISNKSQNYGLNLKESKLAKVISVLCEKFLLKESSISTFPAMFQGPCA